MLSVRGVVFVVRGPQAAREWVAGQPGPATVALGRARTGDGGVQERICPSSSSAKLLGRAVSEDAAWKIEVDNVLDEWWGDWLASRGRGGKNVETVHTAPATGGGPSSSHVLSVSGYM